jgi:hypothetical protein
VPGARAAAARSPSPTGPSRTARGRGSATRPTTWTTCPRARPWWSTMRAAPPAPTGGRADRPGAAARRARHRPARFGPGHRGDPRRRVPAVQPRGHDGQRQEPGGGSSRGPAGTSPSATSPYAPATSWSPTTTASWWCPPNAPPTWRSGPSGWSGPRARSPRRWPAGSGWTRPAAGSATPSRGRTAAGRPPTP